MRTEIDTAAFPRYFVSAPGCRGAQGRAAGAELFVAAIVSIEGGSVYNRNGWFDGTQVGPGTYLEWGWREASEAEAYSLAPQIQTSQLADKYRVPSPIVEGILAYWRDRMEPGGFLRAVFENDLFAAVGKADRFSTEALANIVKLIYNQCPSVCHGNPKKVEAWLAARPVANAAPARRRRSECALCREEDETRRAAHEAGANVQSMPMFCPHPRPVGGATGC